MALNVGGARDEILRQRNEELEIQIKKSLERQEKTRKQVEKTTQRIYVVEESEKRLNTQVGEIEAKALDHVRLYQAQIRSLNEQLDQAQALLQSFNSTSPNRFYVV
ncbi:hypothetical protein MKW98_000984 [Papaver atlanticum]|uniref:Uncharacterized protein n=1 Tax=Papaver atlanticum TaxID=357466 RepID=A0AAD4SDL8_9MAGN|nr:hypothetical protein MKW98_000984 [Papaver atlanticum]